MNEHSFLVGNEVLNEFNFLMQKIYYFKCANYKSSTKGWFSRRSQAVKAFDSKSNIERCTGSSPVDGVFGTAFQFFCSLFFWNFDLFLIFLEAQSAFILFHILPLNSPKIAPKVCILNLSCQTARKIIIFHLQKISASLLENFSKIRRSLWKHLLKSQAKHEM